MNLPSPLPGDGPPTSGRHHPLRTLRLTTFYLVASLAALVLVLWLTSYHTAPQLHRSTVDPVPGGWIETSRDLVSNTGSLSISTEHREVMATKPIPSPASDLTWQRATFSSLDGFLARHWFHTSGGFGGSGYQTAGTEHDISISYKTRRQTVPHWSLFLPLALTAAVLYPRPSRTTP